MILLLAELGWVKYGKGISKMWILLLVISILTSFAGSICGIGGGIILKPVLDFIGVADVSTISFLSSCVVLSMSLYSVVRTVASSDKNSDIDWSISIPLAIGAALGGVLGRSLFRLTTSTIKTELVTGIQAISLAVLTIASLIYTLKRDRISNYEIRNKVVCFIIGLALGVMSSFLGIGGGPINLVALYFFFSMNSKTAAGNSLFIILVSQLSGLTTQFITGAIPDFKWLWLTVMVAGGFLGGIVGRRLNKSFSEKNVRQLFICLLVIIIAINFGVVLKSFFLF